LNQLKRILIGYDGSPRSDRAIENLKTAGLPESLDAVILTASDFLLPPAVRAFGLGISTREIKSLSNDAIKSARASANKAALRLRTMFPKWRIKTEASAQSPTQALIDKARRWKSDLIVVGAHGHSRVGRFLGSISQLVLAQAPCSVRIARSADAKSKKETRIMVAIDGSEGAELAVEAVKNRLWPANAAFRIIAAFNIAPTVFPRMERIKGREIAAQIIGARVKLFPKKFPAVSYRVFYGDPKNVIVNEARNWSADSIFLGARSLSSTRRLFLGGVSMAVAARAHCTVEVIRSIRPQKAKGY